MFRDDIAKTVLDTLAEFVDLPAEQIVLEHRLLDLGLDGDDFSLDFVPLLEKRLGTDTTQREWDGVESVGDVVALFRARLNARSTR